MSRPVRQALLLAFASTLLLAGCGPSTPESRADAGSGVQVTDGLGRTVHLDAPARRIVSLVPSATLTLDALDARDAVVGRTDFDTLTWAAGLPSVGGGLQPSMEALVALEPDLVVLFGGDQDPVTPARLDDVGIPWVGIRPDRVADVLDIVTLLGAVTDREERAERLAADLRAGLDAVARSALEAPGPRVAYVMGGTPPWVAGPGTYIHELIELAGGRNAFADLVSLYSSVSPEELIARDIDVVLVPDRARYDTTLTPGARVEEMGDDLELPGPGVVRAARDVAAALRGDPR